MGVAEPVIVGECLLGDQRCASTGGSAPVGSPVGPRRGVPGADRRLCSVSGSVEWGVQGGDIRFGETFQQPAGQAQQLLLDRRELIGHGCSQPGVALADVLANSSTTVVGDGEQRSSSVFGIGPPDDQPGCFEGGEVAGERLGLDTLRAGQITWAHRTAAAQKGQHGELQEGLALFGSLQAESPGEPGDPSPQVCSFVEQVVALHSPTLTRTNISRRQRLIDVLRYE